MIPPIFVQNVYEMYIKISYTFQRIPDTVSRVITKVYDFMGQPSYMLLSVIKPVDSLFEVFSWNIFMYTYDQICSISKLTRFLAVVLFCLFSYLFNINYLPICSSTILMFTFFFHIYFIFIYLFIYLFIYFFIYLLINLFVYLFLFI